MDGITVGGGRERFTWRRCTDGDSDESYNSGRQISRQPHQSRPSTVQPHHQRFADAPRAWRPTSQPPPFRTPSPEEDYRVDDKSTDTPDPASDKTTDTRDPATPAAHATQHPQSPPPSVDRPRPPAPATAPTPALVPRVLTPRWLLRHAQQAHDGEAWLTVAGVSQAEYDAYISTHARDAAGEDGRRSDALRMEYNPATGDLAVRCMASPVHDIVGDFFTRATYADGRAAHSSSGLRIGMQEFRGFDGIDGLSASASKTPDFCIRPRGLLFPTLAVEVGWCESLAKLRADACLFLTGTGGVTRAVVLIRFVETFPAEYRPAEGGGAVMHSHAVAGLKHAMPGGLAGTADVPPSCTAAPDEMFPAMTCIDTLPFLAASKPVTPSPMLALPLSALVPEAGSSANLEFDLGLLAAAILEEISQMERHRAIKRAAQTIKDWRATLAKKILSVNSLQGQQPSTGRGEKRTASLDVEGDDDDNVLQAESVLEADDNSAPRVPFTMWKKMKLCEDEDEEEDEHDDAVSDNATDDEDYQERSGEEEDDDGDATSGSSEQEEEEDQEQEQEQEPESPNPRTDGPPITNTATLKFHRL